MGPGDPRRRDLDFRQPLQQLRVALDLVGILQRRRVPGAAHHGDALEPLLLRGADRRAHEGLALRLLALRRRRLLAQRGHRRADALEQSGRILPLLDLMLPPQLAIAVAGGLGEQADRIVVQVVLILRWRDRRVGIGCRSDVRCVLWRRLLFALPLALRSGLARLQRSGKPMRLRHVDEAGGYFVLEGVTERLPFRREHCEGIEHRQVRRLRRIDQQRHRRLQLGMRDQRQHLRRIRRPLDQHDIRAQGLERGAQRARAAWSVMPDAEDVEGHGLRWRRVNMWGL
jgi:hypothetical protein